MAILGRRTLRSSRAKTKRIDRTFSRVAYTLLSVYAIFMIAVWLSERDVFRIDSVSVFGSQAIAKDVVEKIARAHLEGSYLFRIEKNNAVLIPRQQLSSAVSSLDARIKHVDIGVRNRKELSIGIEEYQPAILWCGNDGSHNATSSSGCFVADSLGYVFAHAPEFSGYPFPVFRTQIAFTGASESPIGLFVLPAKEYERLSQFSDALKEEGIVVHEVTQKGEEDYALRTDEKWQILWSTRREPLASADHLRLALPEISKAESDPRATTTLSYIDLRFENKIFYR